MIGASRIYDTNGTPIAWVPEWAGPHEGGMTLAMKYAWANALDGVRASKSICGKSLVQHYSPRLHGRSFLVPGWARVVEMGAQPTIGELIGRRDMSRYTGRAGQWLAADTYFRYCPECIQHGYQSILYQIDALKYCPIHGAELLSTCRQCGAPTARYALTAEAMANVFCCPACGSTYGRCFNPGDWKCTALHAHAGQALLPLVRFLILAGRTNIDWVHWDEWFGRWLGEPDQRERRIATCAVLRRLVPHHLYDGIFAAPLRPISVSSGCGFSSPPTSAVAEPADQHIRRQIYKAIRRHLVKDLPRHVDRRLLLAPKSEEINLRDGMLGMSLNKCPYLQALWLWRARFEQLEALVCLDPLQHPTLSLREVALNWPWEGAADEAGWAHYVLAGFHAAAEIVFEWWSRATAIAALPGGDPGGLRSIELYTEFANVLSPSRLPVPPRIAAVFGPRDPRKDLMALYVVGPTGGNEMLRACCRCTQSNSGAFLGEKWNSSPENLREVQYRKAEIA